MMWWWKIACNNYFGNSCYKVHNSASTKYLYIVHILRCSFILNLRCLSGIDCMLREWFSADCSNRLLVFYRLELIWRLNSNKVWSHAANMADVDPETLLEWLQIGQGDERDMQLIALEQLCMLLLMSDNVDRCFERWKLGKLLLLCIATWRCLAFVGEFISKFSYI